MNKKELREKMLSRNVAMSETERSRCDAEIYENLISLPEFGSADYVFSYVGVGSEVSTDAILDRLFSDGKKVCVPLCYGKGVMSAVLIDSKEDLVPGRYNIPEPRDTENKVLPEKLDLIIVPGVAFGEDGSRLGRGGGYYDRFLNSAKNAKKIALCREINMEKTVPCEDHDEYVDIVVTESRIVKI